MHALLIGAVAVAALCIALVSRAALVGQARTAACRRQLIAAPCPACGVAYGQGPVAASEREARRRFAEARRRGVRPRIPPGWNVVCPSCGATTDWRIGPELVRGETSTPAESSVSSAGPGA